MQKLTFCILHAGRIDCTIRCIEAIKETTHIPFKILLLIQGHDNMIKRRLYEHWRGLWNLEVTTLFNECNTGCPAGRKKLLEHVDTPLIMMLDNDVYLKAGWLDNCLKALEKPEIVAVGVPLYDRNGKMVAGTGGFYRINNGVFRIIPNKEFKKDFVEVDTLSEGCMIFKDMIKDFMDWDEGYEMGYGGQDMFLRFHKNCVRHGLKTVVSTKSRAEHWQSSSSEHKSLRMDYPKLARSYARFRKNTGLKLPLKKHFLVKYVYPLLRRPIANFLRWMRRKPPLIWIWKPKVM